MADIVLHAEPRWISPYVFSCFVTLREKGLPFETTTLDTYAGDARRADYLARTITGRVPSLSDGEFALAESSAIVEYLEERYPTPRVLPSDARERARCRQLMSWLRSDDTAIIREERPSTTIFYTPEKKPLGEDARRAVEKLDGVVQRLIGDRAELFGAWCIADSELAFMLMRLIRGGDRLSSNARTYAEAQWQRPSVQEYVKHERLPSP